MKVLIVDDEPLAREVIAGLLARHEDMEVVGQAGGFSAPGINHHEFPAPLTQCFQAAPDVRYGHQTTV